MLSVASTLGVKALSQLGPRELVSAAKVANNMHQLGYSDGDVALWLRAFYMSSTRQELHSVWRLFDEHGHGAISAAQLEERLVGVYGQEARERICTLMHGTVATEAARSSTGEAACSSGTDAARKWSGAAAAAAAAAAIDRERMVRFGEFCTLVPAIAQEHMQEDDVLGLAGRGVRKWLSALRSDADAVLTQVQKVRLGVTATLPPQLLARAGALVQRLQAAGYSAEQAGDAVEYLYCRRDDSYALLKMWALWDKGCEGALSAADFDGAMRTLSGSAISADELAALRRRIGCVDIRRVTFAEFEAALRLLVPPNGAEPMLRDLHQELELSGLLGGADRVERLRPFERQRAAKLAQRMLSFGYSREMQELFLRTLFLTQLHNLDLWELWRGITNGAVDEPISLEKTRHLLALISEERSATKLDELVRHVDSDGSGEIEFDEFAVMVQGVNPRRFRQKPLEEVSLETHPLLDEIQRLQRLRYPLMRSMPAAAQQQADRAKLLEQALRTLSRPLQHVARAEREQALKLVERVSALCLAAARDAQARGSLSEYMSDTHGDMLCKLSQALLSVVELMRSQPPSSYESHVAIRTLRTVVDMERLSPSRPIEWAMDGSAAAPEAR